MPAIISEILTSEKTQRVEFSRILGLCQEITDELNRLEWFDRVNEAAVEKLFAKLAKHGQGVKETHQHHLEHWRQVWDQIQKPRLGLYEQVNQLTSRLSSASGAVKPESSSKSRGLNLYDHGSSESLDSLYSALQEDPASLVLLQAAASVNGNLGRDHGQSSYHIFELAVLLSFDKTLGFLIGDGSPPTQLDVSSGLLSSFIKTTSCRRASKVESSGDDGDQASQEDVTNSLFNQMLSRLGVRATAVLRERDASGYLPLHYAAKYGQIEICMAMETLLSKSGDPADRIQTLTTVDNDKLTPLHHAVVGNHIPTLTALLDSLLEAAAAKSPEAVSEAKSLLGDLLLLALQAHKDDLVELILGKEPDLGRRTIHGESALYVAAQAGRFYYAKLLLDHHAQGSVQIDAPDETLGWTPLMVACADGHRDIAELLLEAGANRDATDPLGWTANEHATYRGHLAVSELFGMAKTAQSGGGPAASLRKSHEKLDLFCGAGQKLIIVVIGSVQNGHGRAPIELDGFIPKAGEPVHASPTYLEVSTVGVEDQSQELRLPLLEDQVNDPIVFQVQEDTPPQIVVRVSRHDFATGKLLIGSGTVLLDEGNRLLGAQRETLLRERTVVILDKDNMKPVGKVRVSYVIASSFPQLDQGSPPSYSRRPEEPVRVFGHRGEWGYALGKPSSDDTLSCRVWYEYQRQLVPPAWREHSHCMEALTATLLVAGN